MLNLQIVDYQGSCPEAGIGTIVSLKTVLSLQIIDYQGSCPEAGRGIILLLKKCSACKLLIIRVLALRLAQGFSCLIKNNAQPANY